MGGLSFPLISSGMGQKADKLSTPAKTRVHPIRASWGEGRGHQYTKRGQLRPLLGTDGLVGDGLGSDNGVERTREGDITDERPLMVI